MNFMRPRLLLLLPFTWFALAAIASAADDTLVHAKDLYRSAAYDEALALLDRMAGVPASEDQIEVSEYRVFCLIALDRQNEARSAIEVMVNADPFYQLPVERASPRVRSVFEDVRQSLLPTIVQRTYTEAKAAFDRQDPKAAVEFERVVNLLNDPDLKASPALADLRTVAAAFRDLSAAISSRPPAAPAAGASAIAPARSGGAAPVAAARSDPASAPAATAPQIAYSEGEPNIVPPTIINQTMPKWVPPLGAPRGELQGTLEVVIDESGDVISATVRKPIHPTYDWQLVKAAQSWKYRPAMKDGVPTRYVKIVTVRLNTTN